MRSEIKRSEESSESRRRRPAANSYQLELGSKALVTLFCGLAVVCGMFFAFGYTLGKHAIPSQFSLGSAPAASAVAKPAGNPAATSAPAGVQPPNPADLGAAESDQTPATLTPATPPDTTAAAGASSNSAPAAGAPEAVPVSETVAKPAAPVASLPAATNTPPAAMPSDGKGIYRVQVFAGAKADADSLANALRGRGYPVVVAPPAAGETDLYRVQVGPFLTVDAAQAMRTRLTGDGYQAIVKQ